MQCVKWLLRHAHAPQMVLLARRRAGKHTDSSSKTMISRGAGASAQHVACCRRRRRRRRRRPMRRCVARCFTSHGRRQPGSSRSPVGEPAHRCGLQGVIKTSSPLTSDLPQRAGTHDAVAGWAHISVAPQRCPTATRAFALSCSFVESQRSTTALFWASGSGWRLGLWAGACRCCEATPL